MPDNTHCPAPTLEKDGMLHLKAFSFFTVVLFFRLAVLDIGDPVICAGYDLEDRLCRENTTCMACEDGLAPDNDDYDIEVEAATSQPLQTATQQPETPPDATALTREQKKKNIKSARNHAKRRTTTVEALNSTTALVPTPHVLEKAAQSAPINVSFTTRDFCLNKPLDHPLLAHANEPEILKAHMQYVDWQGEKCHVVLDRKQHIISVLISPPEPGEDWAAIVAAATITMHNARDKMTFPADAYHHCRAAGKGFPTATRGFTYGGGRKIVGNIKASSKTNVAAIDEHLSDPSIE
ncbi:hypothetical protein DFH08DRAFT_803495 [Mycena albidolilacea]|uniref:Uncharacterized protein n=1 Tax=Mycena albidolilacea TaxID=1033008 RepID=A0AAD7EWS3_9AGAR|nr:hypothetical protein DFH08DRAFT_803495 [Mycena albidolilacea]